MSLASDLADAVASIVPDAALLRAIVQGPASGGASLVTLPGGVVVKSLARIAQEMAGGHLLLAGGTLTGDVRAPNFIIANQLATDAGTMGFTNSNGPAWVFFGNTSAGLGVLTGTIAGATIFTLNATGAVVTPAGLLGFNGRGRFKAPSDGVFTLLNSADTGFSLLQFGGTTASFPALKRSSAALQARLADDSLFANFAAASFVASSASVWPFDSTALAQTIANGATFNLPAGGGLVVLTENTTGQCGLFIIGGGTVILVSQTSTIYAAGAPGGGKIGLEFSGGVYRINNNTGSSYVVGIGGMRVRPSV